MALPDAWEEEEDRHVPGVHADDEPEGGPLPKEGALGTKGRGRIYFDVVGEGGGEDQDSVVDQDSPAQYYSQQVNVRSPG